MGVWGPGNFDNDGAGDYLDSIIKDLTLKIIAYTSPDMMSMESYWASYGEEKLLPTMDILITLCEHYRTPPDLEPEMVTTWKTKYMEVFDEQIQHYGPKEDYLKNRRAVVVETFDKLQRIAEEWKQI